MLSNFIVSTLRYVLGEDQAKKILKKAGVEMGENTAKRLESEHEIKDWSIKSYEEFFVKDYLEKVGAEPEIIEVNDKKIVYRLHNCLFFEMAVKMPEIMCDVLHEGFHEGLARAMGKNVRVDRLTCMSKGDPYCEHSCEWQK
jgi:predicted hydrocarbon binding protein